MPRTKDSPRVSVTIATYNRAHLIGRAIQSVINQTYEDFELILVDDGSTDNTKQVINSFNDDRVSYIRHHKSSGGATAPRNTALKVARGEYIAVLDDDDFWSYRCKLEEQVEFLDTHPDYVLVGTNAVVVDENDRELTRNLFPETDEEIRFRLLRQNCFSHSTVMYRKWAAMVFGGYNPVKGTSSLNDYELWLQLGTVGKFANLPIYGIHYTTWSGNISSQKRIIKHIDDAKLISKYRNRYPNYWRAIRLRYIDLISTSLQAISALPPFLRLKEFLKSRCPVCWRAIKFSHRVIFKSMI